MTLEQLDIQGFEVAVRRSNRRRTIGITVERDGSVTAVAPTTTKIRTVEEAILRRAPWILARIEEKAEFARPAQPKQFVSGEGFPYLGRFHRLLIVDPQELALLFEAGRWKLAQRAVPDARKHFIDWYQDAAEHWIEDRIRRFSTRIGIKPVGFQVRDIGFRWGSCGVDEQLNFHWAVVLLPRDLAEYVVVHELTHLGGLQHSSAFWQCLTRILPDAPNRRVRLASEATKWLW